MALMEEGEMRSMHSLASVKAIRRAVAAAAVLVGLAAMGASAQASPITFSLSNVNFDDGGSASGSFVYDPSTLTFDSWNFSTTAGSQVTSDHTIASTIGSTVLSDPHGFIFHDQTNGSSYLGLNFSSALTSASSGTIALLSGGSGPGFQSYNSFQSRSIIAGGSIVAATPIPASLPLFLTALAAIAWFAGSRKRRAGLAHAA